LEDALEGHARIYMEREFSNHGIYANHSDCQFIRGLAILEREINMFYVVVYPGGKFYTGDGKFPEFGMGSAAQLSEKEATLVAQKTGGKIMRMVSM
jgi:hypothetical protein